MFFYLVLFSLSFCISFFLIPIMEVLGPKIGAMYNPGELSIHSKPIPRLGGLTILIALFIPICCIMSLTNVLGQDVKSKLLCILIGGAVIVGTGLLDDIKRISPQMKFLGQSLVAVLSVLFGIVIGFIPIIYIGILLTIFYIVGGSNFAILGRRPLCCIRCLHSSHSGSSPCHQGNARVRH